jgi:acyl-CoA reductase-like NAD-dependent aldehyde dehydrogenase
LSLHLPLLRRGRPYRSLDVVTVPHHRTREPFVQVSQANAGLVRRDLLQQPAMKASLDGMSVARLEAVCREAAGRFLEGVLPVDDQAQSPEDYVRQTSATTGLPHVLVRRNMAKVHGVLENVGRVVRGLARVEDLTVLESGEYVPRGSSLGVVLPSNSPGVHALWVPSIALKVPLVLKPGSAEPWTPYRIVQALMAAGAPEDAFAYYPASHEAGSEVLRRTGRGIVFGDVASTARWRSDPRIEVHGPGYSKVVLGPGEAEQWPRHLDLMVASVLENAGRSCVNASGVWTTGHAAEIAEALAERLAGVRPRAAEDEAAQLAPFADVRVAERVSAMIDQHLAAGGARDVTARHRPEGRVARWDGCTYLLPTVIACNSVDHPLAHLEFPFPFVAVVGVRAEDLPEALGPTLAATLLTTDAAVVRRVLASPLVHRLNLGPMPTYQVRWDQPHEGNLFEHLYTRRALAVAQ